MCVFSKVPESDEELKFFNFKSIEVSDRKIIQSYIDKFQPQSCEYSFANIYSWQDAYNTTWKIYKQRLVIYDNVNRHFFMPLGKEMTPKKLFLFSQDMRENGLGTDIGVVSPQYLEKYPEIEQFYTIVDQRDFAEYLYSVEALCELKGTRLHKKKNLISQFHRKYTNSAVRMLSGELIKKAKTLADEIFNGHERFLKGIENEQMALIKALNDFEKIGLEGMALIIGNDLVAFSIFSPLNHDTYDIHYEKSCHQFKGAAQVINHETSKYLREKCRYLNREQDLGIKGLRQAKISYDPESLIEVHSLVFKDSS
ncbi:MAG: DUF2156 domain-containing protein [Desulfobacula sp.]|jgi:hypothetical protein|uniref:DUF2156 domain-containing protein n=1 Tax=Desulfobacula sp. TaxID=2593537 RepID=UPI001D895C7D|nr:DUF2156 domain-containing protein [Desulfobacula sp.]MBT3483630.1 DUF2156 domain-containing protein [Desulfobacula sp.]MBT3804911.1 DUF2156 domain-containing protein [Desulfobacula sp.]MBT4023387.1 DUF2156 domain-containing protein [Desulfobacula sp.]MBT4197373.1 DUF2156 domain-containing protein [Desulfobacula sp.]